MTKIEKVFFLEFMSILVFERLPKSTVLSLYRGPGHFELN